jgi:hypothetical protein
MLEKLRWDLEYPLSITDGFCILENAEEYIYPLHLSHYPPAPCSCCEATPVRIPSPVNAKVGSVPSHRICSPCHYSSTRLTTNCISKTENANFPSLADLVPPPTPIIKHACRCHKSPMSLWLSGPRISLSDYQISILQRLPSTPDSITLVFFWTFLVTSLVILSLALRNAHHSPQDSHDTPSLPAKLRLHRFAPADEEKAVLMAKDGYVTIKI